MILSCAADRRNRWGDWTRTCLYWFLANRPASSMQTDCADQSPKAVSSLLGEVLSFIKRARAGAEHLACIHVIWNLLHWEKWLQATITLFFDSPKVAQKFTAALSLYQTPVKDDSSSKDGLSERPKIYLPAKTSSEGHIRVQIIKLICAESFWCWGNRSKISGCAP